MFGLFMSLISGTIAVFDKSKQSIENEKYLNDAKNKNNSIYFDIHGTRRSVKTNNVVIAKNDENNTSWSYVDSKTGEKFGNSHDTLKGRSEKLDLLYKENKKRCMEQNEKNRKLAMERGYKTYSAITAIYSKGNNIDRTTYRKDMYDTESGMLVSKGSIMF